MAAGDISRIVFNPGRIVIGPTDLSAAYPYGGTEIGKANLCALASLGEGVRVMSEGLGEATDKLEPSTEWTFACFLRGWDDDALAKLFPNQASPGAVSQRTLFEVPGSKVPGASAMPRAVVLLFVPDDLIHGEAVLLYNGIAEWTDGTEFALQRGIELGLPVTVDCYRDTNGRILAVGRFADLSLT